MAPAFHNAGASDYQGTKRNASERLGAVFSVWRSTLIDRPSSFFNHISIWVERLIRVRLGTEDTGDGVGATVLPEGWALIVHSDLVDCEKFTAVNVPAESKRSPISNASTGNILLLGPRYISAPWIRCVFV